MTATRVRNRDFWSNKCDMLETTPKIDHGTHGRARKEWEGNRKRISVRTGHSPLLFRAVPCDPWLKFLVLAAGDPGCSRDSDNRFRVFDLAGLGHFEGFIERQSYYFYEFIFI